MDRPLDAGPRSLVGDGESCRDLLIWHVEVVAKDENQPLVVADPAQGTGQIDRRRKVRRRRLGLRQLGARLGPPFVSFHGPASLGDAAQKLWPQDRPLTKVVDSAPSRVCSFLDRVLAF